MVATNLSDFAVRGSSPRLVATPLSNHKVGGSSPQLVSSALSNLEVQSSSPQSVATPFSNPEVRGLSPWSITPAVANLGVQGTSPRSVATTLSKVEVQGSSPPSVAPNLSNLVVWGSSPRLVAPNLFHQHDYVRDRLDDHVEKATAAFQKSSSWGDFIRSIRGRGNLHPEVGSLSHPAAHLLSRFQKSGTPAVLSAPPWSNAKIEMTLQRALTDPRTMASSSYAPNMPT